MKDKETNETGQEKDIANELINGFNKFRVELDALIVQAEAMNHCLEMHVKALKEKGRYDLEDAFVDGVFWVIQQINKSTEA